MFLKTVSLQNFRNYQKKTFEFEGQTTLVVGSNTSGKTNLLEAIYLLATGKSFRAEVESEMITYGQEIARVEGQINIISSESGKLGNGKWEASREMGVGSGNKKNSSPPTSHFEILLTIGSVSGRKVDRKKYLVNGISRRMIDFVGQLKAVYFGPEDLQLVTDSPSLRRRYLDMVLSQVDREYRRASLSYEKGLRQRNKVLEEIREKYQGYQKYQEYQGKEDGEVKRRLYFWDQLLVKNGNYITDKREEMVDFVNKFEIRNSLFARKLAQSKQFEIEYVKSVISPVMLEQNFEKEARAGMTLYGPHRDDIKFKLKAQNSKLKTTTQNLKLKNLDERGRDLSIYGSRGEQRLAVLWLKMGELEFISSKTEARPVLLLDDIFSELDEEHRKVVLGVLGNQQTIITTTDEGTVEKNEREKMQVVYLY